VIQENIPQTIKDTEADQTLLRYVRLSDAAVAADPKADLVAWPETMVTATINKEWLGLPPEKFDGAEGLGKVLTAIEARKVEAIAAAGAIKDAELRKEMISDARYEAWRRRCANAYEALNQEVQRQRMPLLVGYTAIEKVMQNRTLLMTPGTAEAVRSPEYSKRHLVPFGEYIPFKDVPLVNRLMLLCSPVDFDYSNTPGKEWTRFRLAVTNRNMDAAGTRINNSTRFYEFGTPICFEDVMPEPAREMTRAHGRKADFLVNVSNDGWFFWVELDQHLQACQLRAVENRVPIARSVNTGDSGFIDSCGRIVKLVRDRAGNAIGAVGMDSWVVQIDARETFFSRIGDLFPIICGIVGALLVGWTLVRPRRPGMASAAASSA
jgi:apolipoprotein N-acyltransferase